MPLQTGKGGMWAWRGWDRSLYTDLWAHPRDLLQTHRYLYFLSEFEFSTEPSSCPTLLPKCHSLLHYFWGTCEGEKDNILYTFLPQRPVSLSTPAVSADSCEGVGDCVK